MKRLQIMIDEDLDESVGRVARDEGISKAAVIRRILRTALDPLPPLSSDPLFRLIGSVDAEPASIDEVVYGR
jgi:hypothetical protein